MPNCTERVPLYIAVEGAKGAGKTTALAAVRHGLRQAGIRAASLDPTAPGCVLHPFEWLYRVLPGVDGIAEYLYAYRSNRQAHVLDSNHMARDLILGDRSFMTTLATRWHRTHTIGERAHFERCRSLESAIPIPDHVIYIHAPIAALRRRLELRRRRYGAQDECLERLKHVQEAYAAIRRSSLPELRRIKWHLISGVPPADRVAAAVLRVVLAILAHEKRRNAVRVLP